MRRFLHTQTGTDVRNLLWLQIAAYTSSTLFATFVSSFFLHRRQWIGFGHRHPSFCLCFFVFSSRVVAFYHRHCRNGNRHRHCYSLSSSLLYTHRYKEPALFPSHSLFTFHEKTRQTDKDGRFSKSESFRKSQTVGADDAAKSRRDERILLRAKREKKKKKQKATNEREMIPAFELLVVSACCVYHFAK